MSHTIQRIAKHFTGSLLFVAFILCVSTHHEALATTPIYDPETDLGVTKTGPDQAPANSNVTYQIIVTNNGPDNADNATMSDTLPAGMTFVSLASPSGWNCTTPGAGNTGTITCINPSLAITQNEVFTLVAHTDSAVMPGSFITNKAAVTTTTPDINDENNESASSFQVAGSGGSSDAGIQIAVDKELAFAGDNLIYTITVINSGNATNVFVTDPLPAGLLFTSLSFPAGWSCTHPSPGSGGNVVCSIGTLPQTSGQTFTIGATIPSNTAATTVFTNTVTISTASMDPNSENDQASVATTVQANYVVTPTSGSGQTTAINNPFASPLQATVTLSGVPQNNVNITFQAPASGASGTFTNDSSSIVVSTDSNGVATSPTFTANNIVGGPYNVTASASSGTAASFSLTNSKASQTINFPPVPGQTYGNNPLTLTATASSNLPVSFNVLTGPGTLNGSSLTFTGAGSITVRATQPGDSNYAPATPVDQVIAVAKANPSTTVTSSQSPSSFGQNIRFIATITPPANTTIPSGTVQFKDGSTNLGSPVTCLASNNVCTAQVSTTILSPGAHAISATYSGDANFNSSTGTLPNGQIVNASPTLSINDVSANEGNSGTTSFDFTVTISSLSSLQIKVDYATADGTATIANNDYQKTSGTLTFNPGEHSKTITVLVNGDLNREADETFFVKLSNPSNATINRATGQGTIVNDDTVDPPQIVIEESGPSPDQAAALDSVLLLRDPFSVKSAATWLDLGPDQNTRVILFATALTLNSGETASAVLVNVVGSDGQSYDVPAEDVRPVPNAPFTQVIFRLPDTLATGRTLVTLRVHGQFSNTATIRIK